MCINVGIYLIDVSLPGLVKSIDKWMKGTGQSALSDTRKSAVERFEKVLGIVWITGKLCLD
jgi:hypothetical protein